MDTLFINMINITPLTCIVKAGTVRVNLDFFAHKTFLKIFLLFKKGSNFHSFTIFFNS